MKKKNEDNSVFAWVCAKVEKQRKKVACGNEITRLDSLKTLSPCSVTDATDIEKMEKVPEPPEASEFIPDGTGKSNIPVEFKAANYIKKNFRVFAACDRQTVYIYRPRTGCYDEMNADGKFATFLSQVFCDTSFAPHLTESLEKKIFHHICCDHRLQISPDKFEMQERFLNVKNGVIDLETGKLEPHSHKYGFLHMLKLPYDPNYAASKKKPKRFETMLKRNFPDHKNRKRFLQCLAYLISNRYTNKVAFYWLGPPHTGKSTYQRLLTKIVGEEQVTNLSLRNLAKPFAIATLSDKKLNFCGETGRTPIKNLDIFKALLGNDYIDAEYKFQNHFSFHGRTKCVFAGNDMLNIDSNIAEDAIFERFQFIVFRNPVGKGKQIPLFEEQLLKEEGPEILAYLVRTLQDWYGNGSIFTESKSSKKEKSRFRRQSKSVDVIKAFVKHCCVLDPRAESSYKELYDRYVAYCSSNCFAPMPQQTFIKQLMIATDVKRQKFHPSRTLQFWGLKGISLKKTVPPVPLVP